MSKGQLGLEMLPQELDTPAFAEAWKTWLVDRAERRLPRYTARAQELQLRRLAEMGSDPAVAAIEWSIAQGYKGIFPPPQSARPAAAKPLSTWDIKQKLEALEGELSSIAYDYCGPDEDRVNDERRRRRVELREKIRSLRSQLTA